MFLISTTCYVEAPLFGPEVEADEELSLSNLPIFGLISHLRFKRSNQFWYYPPQKFYQFEQTETSIHSTNQSIIQQKHLKKLLLSQIFQYPYQTPITLCLPLPLTNYATTIKQNTDFFHGECLNQHPLNNNICVDGRCIHKQRLTDNP
eukprot:TRINITY_DN13959_c0_g1_i4.p1 TRINITY_DN13959_c0_g1~~TRINITY_DN13959_c0_g1_i4.p1  ORF type:complete len:148 (+),score=0.38 TRINITY_DN13959_c0_g1_i4:71-514(+)